MQSALLEGPAAVVCQLLQVSWLEGLALEVPPCALANPREARLVVAGVVLFRLALSWLVLVSSGRLEASDEASIHRCQPGNVGSLRSIRWDEHPSLPTW